MPEIFRRLNERSEDEKQKRLLPDIDLVPEIVTQAYSAAERIAERFYPQSQAV